MKCSKCSICGCGVDNLPISPKTSKSREQRKILLSWKRECAKSLCDILFTSEVDSDTEHVSVKFKFLQYFQNGDYCLSCLQIVRDVNFFWKQLKSLQSRIQKFENDFSGLILNNYTTLIENKMNIKLVEQIDPELADYFINKFINGETLKMINFYAVRN